MIDVDDIVHAVILDLPFSILSCLEEWSVLTMINTRTILPRFDIHNCISPGQVSLHGAHESSRRRREKRGLEDDRGTEKVALHIVNDEHRIIAWRPYAYKHGVFALEGAALLRISAAWNA